jgi:hypothetical protein
VSKYVNHGFANQKIMNYFEIYIHSINIDDYNNDLSQLLSVGFKEVFGVKLVSYQLGD